MTKKRKDTNDEFVEHLMEQKGLNGTKARREYLVNKFKITKSRANALAKRAA